jgi:hypothetical protein
MQNAAMTYSDNSFQQILFTANTLIAGAKISLEMIEDSENIDAVVSNSISKALALALDYAALYGSGTAPAPTGIKNQSGVTLTVLGTNGYSLVDWSKFSQGISTLMQANVEGPYGAIYSARTAGELDNLRDTLGQPLHQPDLVSKMAKFVSNQVGNAFTVGTATTTSDAFIGQWDQCMIGYRNSMTMEISREAARERLFDVLMRRLDAMAPYRESLREIAAWLRRDPLAALAFNPSMVNSMRFMLEAAGIDSEGVAGAIKLQGSGRIVLEHCDSQRTFGEIIAELQKRFGNATPAKIRDDISQFLEQLQRKRIVDY